MISSTISGYDAYGDCDNRLRRQRQMWLSDSVVAVIFMAFALLCEMDRRRWIWNVPQLLAPRGGVPGRRGFILVVGPFVVLFGRLLPPMTPITVTSVCVLTPRIMRPIRHWLSLLFLSLRLFRKCAD